MSNIKSYYMDIEEERDYYREQLSEPCPHCHIIEMQRLERNRAIKLFIIGAGVIALGFGSLTLIITGLI